MSGNPVHYACPDCGYDGAAYNDGKDGWVDATSEHTALAADLGPCCGKCGEDVPDAWQCESCGRWLSGGYLSAPDCNDTGKGVTLCEPCAEAWGKPA